jgi:hypothetical protein
MTSAAEPPTWLDAAASILSLSGDTDEDTGYPPELRPLLATGESGLRASEILNDTSPRQRIDAWADFIKEYADRDVFLLFAYFPAQVIAGFPPEIDETKRWSTLVELYTAWSQLTTAGQFSSIDERSRNIASAYFARTRWLLLSLPFRPGWEQRIPGLDLRRINDESSRILTLARQARDDWLAVLVQIDDYPRLKQDIDVEAEAQTITSLQLTRRRLATANTGLNLALPVPGTSERDRAADPDDLVGASVTGYVVTRLLLPRFAVGQSWQVIYGAARWPFRVTSGLAALAGIAALVLLVIGLSDPGSGLLGVMPAVAVGWYAWIALASTRWPWSAWPWLMRQPASAAVALLALALAPPDWWHNSGHEQHIAVEAAVVLTAVGVGYLYMQAGNQDVRGWRRAWRPPVVAASGYLHALMVTVIGLRYVLPEFAPRPAQPPDLSCWWHAAGCGSSALPAWLLVLVAAAWSFAAAVFLQIIWDDQPVTAPLAHVSWRRGS